MRSPGSCVLCNFSDSHSVSFFSLSPSSSLAFCWKLSFLSFLGFSFALLFFFICFCSLAFSWNLRSLSFFGFPVALQFLFISHMFIGILLEVGLFFIFLILIFSPIFRCILQIRRRFPGICVLCHFLDSHSFSSFSLSSSSSLAFLGS